MSKYQFTPSLRLTPIERPCCPYCTSSMMLASINPDPIGFKHRLFINVGVFTSGQKQFLDFHRNAVLLQAVRT